MSLELESNVQVQEDSLEKGNVLFKTGETPENLYLIKTGEVCCFTADKGQIVPIYTAGAGEIVGDEALINKVEYHYNAVAMDDTSVVKIPAAPIQEYLASSPKWISDLMNILSGKLDETSHIISEHKIRDEKLTANEELSPEKQALLNKALKG